MDETGESQSSHAQQPAQIATSYAPAPMPPTTTQAATLLDLPNEVLLTVAAYVPFESGKSIITLRFVNRQLRNLLVDTSNLQQLRKNTAESQYAVANSLRFESEGYSWESLQTLEEDTAIVDQILSHVCPSGGILDVLRDTIFPVTNEEELFKHGLYLFAANARLGVDVSSEIHCASLIVLFDFPLVTVLRLTAIKLKKALGEHGCLRSAPAAQAQFFESSAAPLALENHLVRHGLSVVRDLLTSEDISSADAVDFLEPLLEDCQSISESANFFTALMACKNMHSTTATPFILDASNQWFARLLQKQATKLSWGVVANDLLVYQYWNYEAYISKDPMKVIRALHGLCFQSPNDDESDSAFDENNSSEQKQRRVHMVKEIEEADWYGFDENNIDVMVTFAAKEAAEMGLLELLPVFFQGARSMMNSLQFHGQASPPHTAFLFIKSRMQSLLAALDK